MVSIGRSQQLLLLLAGYFFALAATQETAVPLTPPYFNIAENRNVSVNATCGEGIALKETFCKLVGYDRFDSRVANYDILDGQVREKPYNVTSYSSFNVVKKSYKV